VSEPARHDAIRRVLILSADIGSGHLVASRALAADLERRGLTVEVVEDLRSSLGWLGRLVLRDGSRVLFDHAPGFYDVFYRGMLRFPPARASSAAWLRRFGSRRLVRLVRRHDPDVVVSTYPGITVVLGELRRRRRLAVPVAAVITDLAGLFFWAHRGVDMHLLAWAESAPEVERISGAANVVHVLAPTNAAFFTSVDSQGARARLGLPAAGGIVLVSGGGWGVGGLEDTVTAALAADPTVVVALAGGNDALRRGLTRRFACETRVRVLGFSSTMSDLLAAADVLVHSTAGVTCLEAALRGCPTIVHGFSVGHVRHNAEVMTSLGLVRRATRERGLTDLIRSTLAAPPANRRTPTAHGLPSAADVVVTVQPRIRPIARWRLGLRRLGPVTTSLVVALALGTSVGYAFAARVEDDLKPLSHVAVARKEAALVVRASPSRAEPLIERFAGTHLHATLAMTVAPSAAIAGMATSAGVDIVPAVGPGFHWFRAHVRPPAIRGHHGEQDVPYIAPERGFTLGQYLISRVGDGYPVRPLVESPHSTRAGDVVEASGWNDVIRLARGLSARGMRITTLGTLLRDAA
jgi:processive 1,2-diacylglycerol beta-glucosyltransferase